LAQIIERFRAAAGRSDGSDASGGEPSVLIGLQTRFVGGTRPSRDVYKDLKCKADDMNEKKSYKEHKNDRKDILDWK
jgi:hypothetical protein